MADRTGAPIKCYTCGYLGHYKRFCPNRPKAEVRQLVGGMTEETRQLWREALSVDSPSKSEKPEGFTEAQQ